MPTLTEKTLRQRLKAKDDGLPVGPDVGKVRFTDAAKDLITDYQITGKRSIGGYSACVTRRSRNRSRREGITSGCTSCGPIIQLSGRRWVPTLS